MLTEFEGAISAQGLLEFWQSTGRPRLALRLCEPHVRFWAVIETEAASRILQQQVSGRQAAALRLLEESAISLGSLPRATL